MSPYGTTENGSDSYTKECRAVIRDGYDGAILLQRQRLTPPSLHVKKNQPVFKMLHRFLCYDIRRRAVTGKMVMRSVMQQDSKKHCVIGVCG